MSTFTEALKNTTKTEWIVCFGALVLFIFLYHFSDIPDFIVNPFFHGFTSCIFIYSSFFKKKSGTVKNRLYNAMMAGAFIYLFLESVSVVFAKWTVWQFF